MKKIRILFEYLAAFLVISILLIVITSVAVMKFHGEEVQNYTMELINEQLDTKTSIEEIGVSVFRHFPNTSIFFNEVTVWSGHSYNHTEFDNHSSDTLLAADRIYVKFNIFRLITGKFKIKSFEAENGQLNLLIDSKGNGNFLVTQNEQEKKSEKLIELDLVNLENFDVRFINLAKGIRNETRINSIELSGNFSSNNYLLKTKGDLFVENFADNSIPYLHQQALNFDIDLKVENSLFKISKGKLLLDKQQAEVIGEFNINPSEGTQLDIALVGQRISIDWLSKLALKIDKFPKDISGSGKFDINIRAKGLATSTLSPHIEANFSTANSSVNIKSKDLKIRNLALTGSFSNGQFNNSLSSEIKLNNLQAKINNSQIYSSLIINDFTNPNFSVYLNGNIEIKDINAHISDSIPISFTEGIISPELSLKGRFPSAGEKLSSLRIYPDGEIGISGIYLEYTDSNLKIDNLSGKFKLDEDNWAAMINCFLGKTDISLHVDAIKPMTWFTDGIPLKITGMLESENINIDEIISMFPSEKEKEKEKTNTNLKFPRNIRGEIDFNIGSLKRGNIYTRGLNGTLIYKYPGLYIDPFYLETMDGTINAALKLYDLNKDQYQASIASNFDNVDIKHIFSSFNDFGQDFIGANNLEGKITGKANILAALNPDFSVRTPEMIAESNIVIKDGELNNFQPIMEMSNFLKIDKLDHIEFSTIHNTIQIKDNKIMIPQMNIASSLLHMSASGNHSFEKTFDYHLAIRLSELLFNKARSSKKQEFEIALDKDDQRTLFLLLYDEGEGIIIDFDEEQARKKMRSDFREEKQELKVLFNEEFGLFKKDESVQELKQKKQNEPVMRFEFPEEEEGTDTASVKTTTKDRWWKKKKQTSKKTDLDFVIDESDI